jgi:flagellar assembly protein FliH
MMTQHKKFMFDRDFDQVITAPLPFADDHLDRDPLDLLANNDPVDSFEAEIIDSPLDTSPIIESFSLEELQTAKEQAFEEGRLAGLKEKSDEIDVAHREILEKIELLLTDLFKQNQEDNENSIHDIIDISLAIVKKIAPNLVLAEGETELTTLIEKSLLSHYKGSKLLIKVHPEHLQKTQEFVTTIKNKEDLDIPIKIQEDINLDYGDCIIKWDSGSLERNISYLWTEIDQIAQSLSNDIIKLSPRNKEKSAEERSEDLTDKGASHG